MTFDPRHYEMVHYNGLLIPVRLDGLHVTTNIQHHINLIRKHPLARFPIFKKEPPRAH